MPELPEVETTRRGIAPHILAHTISRLVIRQFQLRWPIPQDLPEKFSSQQILSVERRGKYLLLGMDLGTAMIHLGMSGSLRLTSADLPPKKHDHFDIQFTDGSCLRFHDPRRFGCLLWTESPPYRHPLLADLGPEPLTAGFSAAYLHQRAMGRKTPIKSLIMDGHIVVGIGNIYANEALFRSGIHPKRAAGSISLERYERLATAIREILTEAIAQGGSTLRDFVNEAGNPGYFQQTLAVYNRAGKPCLRCGEPIRGVRLSQRSTFYCPRCQR